MPRHRCACFITSTPPMRPGAAVRSALLRAIDRGVRVSLLIDGFGSSRTHEQYFHDLIAGGARFCRFNPSLGRNYLLRNHQKLALADGDADEPRILIGGFNIEDGYFGESRQYVARHGAAGRGSGGRSAGALLRRL